MAFPTSSATLSVGLARAQSQASAIKRIAQNNYETMAAGPVSASFVITLLDNLKGARSVFDAAGNLPGMAAYAQEQLGQDVTADFVAMVSEIDTVGSLIVSALPKDGSGYLLLETIDAQGNRTERTFTSAQTSGVRSALQDLIATIE